MREEKKRERKNSSGDNHGAQSKIGTFKNESFSVFFHTAILIQ